MTEEQFLNQAFQNSNNRILLTRLKELRLKDCYLVAGCLFQAVWNLKSGWPAERGVKDYDIFYFDDADLSSEREAELERQLEDAVSDLSIEVDLKNQARVHLWYPEKFGAGYPRLTNTRDGIDRYLVECTCVGIRVADEKVYAPNGLEELERGILRINPVNPRLDQFRQKAQSYQARWPWLTISDGNSD